jgi:hypothetical protein
VRLDIGGSRRLADIDANGQAIFTEIPANFRGQEMPVGVQAEGYELTQPDTKILFDGKPAYVSVRQKAGRIAGRVEDEAGVPLSGVAIAVEGMATNTSSTGFFELTVPGDRSQSPLTLQAVGTGYITWTDTVVPNSNDIAITLRKIHKN